MIRNIAVLSCLLALVAGCQQQAPDVAQEAPPPQASVSAPATPADCEQQFTALLNHPVCIATMEAMQARRRQRLMEGYGEMPPTQPRHALPKLQ